MYKLYAMQDDGSEIPVSAKRLRLEIEPTRIVEIDLRPAKDFSFMLHCLADSHAHTSRLIIHPSAANCIRVEVTPKF